MRRVIRFSAWIAAAAAIFLIYSSVDNIPDVPGMLNSKSNRTLRTSASHHSAPDLTRAGLVSPFVSAPGFRAEPFEGASRPARVTGTARAIRQAANLPPPTV